MQSIDRASRIEVDSGMELPDGRVCKRRRTYNTPGEAHEFTFSCYRRIPMLKAERTCEWMLDAIERARVEHDFQVWAFVLMPEHVHLLVMPAQLEHDASAFVKSIKQSVARRAIAWLRERGDPFLERLRRPESNDYHFWQRGTGYDRNLRTPESKAASVRYIHRNPVEAHLAKQPDDWRWSSAKWYARGESVGVELTRPEGFGLHWRGW